MARAVMVLAFSCLSVTVMGQEAFVIPVVSDNAPGLNGSVWATEVQILKVNPHDSLTVRRVWVCTRTGGFLEDPETALTWEMTLDTSLNRMLVLSGGDVLEGTDATLGAVALEVTGGPATVNARIADTSRGYIYVKTPFGQGQWIPTGATPLEGPSHIPWLGGCRNSPCISQEDWDFYRNNIGFVNPNPEPFTVTGTAIPFGYDNDQRPNPFELRSFTHGYQTFTTTIPPYGWVQLQWVSTLTFQPGFWGVWFMRPNAGFVMSLSPDSEAPYFAYASTVFAPDPASGISAFNDPMFIPAQPGFVAPYYSE